MDNEAARKAGFTHTANTQGREKILRTKDRSAHNNDEQTNYFDAVNECTLEGLTRKR